MTIISTNDLNMLRSENHVTKTYMSVHNPDIVFEAIVSVDSARFDNIITFTSGYGDTSMIREGMEIYIGNGINSKSIGIVRLRTFTSGDGISGTMKVSSNNYDFSIGDNITIRLNFKVFPRFPRIVGDALTAVFKKDFDLDYSDQHQSIVPVVIAGGYRAMWLNEATINPHFETSYTMSPGATITNYTANSIFISGVAPTININSSTGIGTITFNSVGSFWIEYQIIDTNSSVQKSYRLYMIHDETDMPITDFGLTSVTGSTSSGGYSATVSPYGSDTTLNDIPDEAQVIIWQDTYYDGIKKTITLLPDENNVVISGYFRTEVVERNIENGTGKVQFKIDTIQQVMGNHFQYSLSLEALNTTPTKWYQYRNELTTLRGVHSFWKYQSTIMEICDVIGLNTDTDMLRPFVELSAGNLFSIVDGLLKNTSIRYLTTVDHGGSIHLIPEPQLLTDAERAVIPETFELSMSDSSSQETIIRKPPNQTAQVRSSGFFWDGSFITNCPTGSNLCPNSSPFCSISGRFPDDDGKSINNFDRQTVRSQTHINQIAGRKFHMLNNLYPEIRVKTHGNYFGVFDISFPYFYTKEYQQVDTLRGLTITGKQTYLRSVTTTIDPRAGTSQTNVVLEVEVLGDIGIFEECVSDFPSGFTPPIIDVPDPIGGCGIPIYTAGTNGFHRYLCSTWLHTTTEDTKDMRADPYTWENVWRCGDGYIKWSDDSGDTWTDLTPTSPPNDASDSPPPSYLDLTYEHMDVAWANQGEFIFLANWDNGSENRLWIVRTLNHGISWTWQSVNVNTTTSGSAPTGILEPSFTQPYHMYLPNDTINSNIQIARQSLFHDVYITLATTTYDTPYFSTTVDQEILAGYTLYLTNSASNDYFTLVVSRSPNTVLPVDEQFLLEYTTDGAVVDNSNLDITPYLGTSRGIGAIIGMRDTHLLTTLNGTDPDITFLTYTNNPLTLASTDTFTPTYVPNSDNGIHILHKLTTADGILMYLRADSVGGERNQWVVTYFSNFASALSLDSGILVSGEFCGPFEYSNYTVQSFMPRIIQYDTNDFFVLTFEPTTDTIPRNVPISFNIYAMRVNAGVVAIWDHHLETDYPLQVQSAKFIDGVVKSNIVQGDRLYVSIGTSEMIEYDVTGFNINAGSKIQTTYYTERYFTTRSSTTDRTIFSHNQLLNDDTTNNDPIRMSFNPSYNTQTSQDFNSLFGYYPKIAGSIKTYEDRYDFNNANALFEYNSELYACLSGDLVLPSIYKFDGVVWELFHEITNVNLSDVPRVSCANTSGTKAYIGIRYDTSNFGRVVEVDMGTLIETFHAFNGQEPNAFHKLGSDLYVGTSQKSSSGDYRHLYLLQAGSWIQQETASNTEDIYGLGEFNGTLYAGTEDNILEWDGIGGWNTVVSSTAIFTKSLVQIGSLLYYSADGGELWGYGTSETLIETVPSGNIESIVEVGSQIYMTTTDYSNEENLVYFDTNNAGAGVQLAYSTFSKVAFTDMAIFNDGVDNYIFYGTGDVLNPSSNPFAGIHKYKIDTASTISYDVHGLGIGLGRETSTVSYITAHDRANNKLINKVFDTNLVDTFTTVLESGVSDADISNRSSWAYPFTDWYQENICYIHGRFDFPASKSYVIATGDFGATWADSGADFGNDVIGSIYVYGDGTIQAIRNRTTGISEIYFIENGLKNYRSIIPFNQTVNAHGMGVNSSGTFVGSDTAQSYMVSKTVYPITAYANYTFNHSVLGDIKSLEVPG